MSYIWIFFFPFNTILVTISLVSMFLKHFSKLTSRVCQTRLQLRKLSLIHSFYTLPEADVNFVYMWISSLIHLIQALDLENTKKKKTRKRRNKDFFVGGFGFARRDGNKGVDLVLLWMGLVLQVTSQGGSLLLFFFFSFFLLHSSSLFFMFVLQSLDQ